MWLKICVLVLCGIYSARSLTITPSKGVFSVAEGSYLQVNCSSRNGVQWSAVPSDAMSTLNQGSVTANGDNISTLTFEQVKKANEATFTCKDAISREEQSFQLKVFNVTTVEAEFAYNQNAMLHCQVNDASKTYTYSWRKGETPVDDIQAREKQKYVQHENGSLEIQNPSRDYAGVYTCIASYGDSGNQSSIVINVTYFASPKVIPFEKSKNLVQDEKLLIECKVLGYPKPSITWFKDNEEVKGEDGSRFKLKSANTYDGNAIDNGKLEIASVDFDDAGEYKCLASHPMWADTNSTQTILVRVKDKLAALWPFLGIVAEVVILCTIIFIYEKKRNKDAAEDEDPNEDGATPEKKSEGVRHRGNTNNPRA